jgi:hypothetical protein
LAENKNLFSAKTIQKRHFWLEIIFYFQPKPIYLQWFWLEIETYFQPKAFKKNSFG